MKQLKFTIMKNYKWIFFLIPLFVFAGCEKDSYTYLPVDNSLPKAGYSYKIDGFKVVLTNTSTDATKYVWDFGDGESSTEKDVEHTFAKKGKYTVILTAADNNDKSDKYSEEIAVGYPKASFSYVADKQTVTFTNTSSNASSYSWDFGDNTTSTEVNPVHTFPAEGTYTVTLTAIDGTDQNKYSEDIFVVGKFIPTILNPSFDDGKNYWQEEGNNFYTTTGPTPPDGTHGAKLKNPGHSIVQTFEVGSHTNYTLKYYTVSKSTSAGGTLTLTDGDGNVLYTEDTGGTPDASNYVQRSLNFDTQASTSVTLKVEYNGTEFRLDMFTIE